MRYQIKTGKEQGVVAKAGKAEIIAEGVYISGSDGEALCRGVYGVPFVKNSFQFPVYLCLPVHFIYGSSMTLFTGDLFGFFLLEDMKLMAAGRGRGKVAVLAAAHLGKNVSRAYWNAIAGEEEQGEEKWYNSEF
jgi:hypothetical protein